VVLEARVPEGHDPRGVGPIRPASGWALHHISGWPHTAGYTIQATYQGVPVARWAPDGEDLRIMAWDESQAREAAAKAERKANHDTYLAQLANVRVALDADPALAGTTAALSPVMPANVAEAHARILAVYGGAKPGVDLDLDQDTVYDWGRAAWGRADVARACLALAGWAHTPGQEGGTLTPPWGGVPVGVRGALHLPREVPHG
jgi:hypothetical protein